MAGKEIRRIALLGGSFDPPHLGHLAIARAARERLSLDMVLFAPTGRQPLKGEAVASFADRLAMTGLLCAEGPEVLGATAMDGPRADGGPNYTVNLLETARARWPTARLFVILGADSFADLPRWYAAERMRAMAEWIVVSRPGAAADANKTTDSRVHWIDDVAVPVASRVVRQRLGMGDVCREALPSSVLRYIRARKLYGTAVNETIGKAL